MSEIKIDLSRYFKEDGYVNYDELSKVKDSMIFALVGQKIVEETMPKEGIDFQFKIRAKVPLREGEKKIKSTLSICPECRSLIRGVVLERDGAIYIRKVCPDHGEIEEVYWSDADFFYKKSKESYDGHGVNNPFVDLVNPCPYNCGLCARHKSHTALLNLVITNRCHLSCWYCFFYAEAAGYIFEPTLDHIRFMMESARSMEPVPAMALQITGGEPTLREDLVEIVKMAKELGFIHVQLNTTGISFVGRPEYLKELREAGVNTLYMSFDGVTPYTNPKNHWEVPYIFDAARKSGMGIVLVPTVIRTVNDHEVGPMLYFALKHNDVVRGINYQPVSLVGRMPKHERQRLRITIPDVVKLVEEHTNGEVMMDHWFSVPFTAPISEFIELVTGKHQFKMTNHFACGVATYLFQDQRTGKITPLPRFMDVEGLANYLKELNEYMRKGGSRRLALVKLLAKIPSFIDRKQTPEQLRKRGRIYKMFIDIFARHDYSTLGKFHLNTLYVGMMHFQDEYNYDVARIQRCDIHYVGPDGRIMPFCTYNVMPEMYRDRLIKRYSVSLKEYLRRTGLKSLSQERYRRNIKKLESDPLYRKTYEGFWDPDSISYEEKKRISIKFGIPVVE